MDFTKFSIATVIGTIVGMVSSGLIFGFLLSSYLSANTSLSSTPDMIWLAVGHLFFAALITYIFMQWAGISTPATGAKAAAIIALLATLAMDFTYYSMSDIFTGGPIIPIVDAIGSAAAWAIAGAAIGWFLGRGKS